MATMEPDDALWQRFKGGDASAWNELVTRHWPTIHRFFVSKAPPEVADELTQRTFLRLEEVRHKFEGRASIKAFFLGVARNILWEYLRETGRNSHVDFDEVTLADLDPGASTLLRRRAEQRRMLEALRQLSVNHQIALELHYWEHMTDREIGDVLEINVNTVRGRLSRAREQLKQKLATLESRKQPLPSTSTKLEDWVERVRKAARSPNENDEDDDAAQ